MMGYYAEISPEFILRCYIADANENGWTFSARGLEAYAHQRRTGKRAMWRKRGLG
jgi:hypothetical protein